MAFHGFLPVRCGWCREYGCQNNMHRILTAQAQRPSLRPASPSPKNTESEQ